MKLIRRFFWKLILIVIVMYATLFLLMAKNYVKKTCEYDSWAFKIPDEIHDMKIVDIGYEVYTGDILIYATDETGDLFCWTTGIKDISEDPYYDKLIKERYVIARKDGKRLGIFKIN